VHEVLLCPLCFSHHGRVHLVLLSYLENPIFFFLATPNSVPPASFRRHLISERMDSLTTYWLLMLTFFFSFRLFCFWSFPPLFPVSDPSPSTSVELLFLGELFFSFFSLFSSCLVCSFFHPGEPPYPLFWHPVPASLFLWFFRGCFPFSFILRTTPLSV